MDGSLPPIATPVPQQGFAPAPQGFSSQPAGQPRPVGRPPADPEVARVREERHQDLKRWESILPKEATDGKILLYRLKDGRLVPGKRPALTILASKLEEAKESGGFEDTKEYLLSLIAEKYGAECDDVFQCQVFDKQGKRVMSIPAFNLGLQDLDDGDDGQDDEGPDDGQDNDQEPAMPQGFQPATGGFHPHAYDPRFAGLLPPAPPAHGVPAAAVAADERRIREEEGRKSSEVLGLVTTLMTSQQQQQQAQQSQMQQMLIAFSQSTAQMTAAQAQQAQAAAERAAADRKASWDKIIALIPLLLPIIQNMFAKKEGIDPATAMLLKMVESKGSEDIVGKMMAAMAAMAQGQMQMQQVAAQGLVQTQSTVMSQMMKNVLEQASEIAKGKPDPEPQQPDSTLSTILQVAGPILAGMASKQQEPAGMPAELPAPPVVEEPRRARRPAPIPPPTPMQVAPPPTPAPQPQSAPKPRRTAPDPSTMTDPQRLATVLATVRNLQTGALPGVKYDEALRWCVPYITPTLREALASGNKDQVVTVFTPVVLAHPPLAQWLGGEGVLNYVVSVADDLRKILAGTWTPEQAKARMQELGYLPADPVVPTAPASDAPAPAEEVSVKDAVVAPETPAASGA